MNKLTLVIDHEPLSWKRPGQAGKIRFDSQKGIKETLSYFFVQAMRKQNIKTFKGPVSVRIVAWYKRPKSNKHYFHQVKPDCDNVAKLYLDIMTMAGVWLDDAQCFNLSVSKNYIFKECPHVKPCVFFEIEELDPQSIKEENEGAYEDISRARRKTRKA